jgi:creatinine amidohydrolase
MSKQPVILELLPWPEIAELREKNGGLLLLPLGATEQHGPHLPVAMDTLLAGEICHAASARTGVPVLSTLRYTVSQGHTAKWPGTFSIRHETFIHTLNDLCDWAVATGWKKILLVNSHFGNDASARVAVDQIRLRHIGALQIALLNVFQLTPKIWKHYTSDADDLHANKAETDLMLYLFPDLVRNDLLSRSDDRDRTQKTVFSYPVSQTSLNGVTGSPSLANAEDGKKLFIEMTHALVEKIDLAVVETPPLEPELWDSIPHPHRSRY